jgi:hypothetical protein
MKTIKEIHTQHNILNSEIHFLQQEIKFFIKLLSKSYNDLTERPKVKILDGYWIEFEKCNDDLKKVAERIKNCEKMAHSKFDKLGMVKCEEDEECTMSLNHVNNNLRTLKESFYAFVIDLNNHSYEKA